MDKQSDVPFPIKGLNVATSFEQQPKETTPLGVNVRAFEAQYGRARGGVRPGLSKWIPPQLPSGHHLITHLNLIVDPQAPALLGDVDPTVLDTSSNNLPRSTPRIPANRYYRRRGSAAKPRVIAPAAAAEITFLQKIRVQPGTITSSTTVTLDSPVTIGSVVFVIVRTEKAGVGAELIETVRNGIAVDYDQVGGSGYYSQTTFDIGAGNTTETLSIWFRTTQTADDRTVVVTPGASGVYEICMLEYGGPAPAGPISNTCKSSGTGTSYILPDLAMNNTTGQMVLAAFINVNNVLAAATGYTPRFSAGSSASNTAVVEKKPISGVGPENPEVDGMFSKPWCGIAAAITR